MGPLGSAGGVGAALGAAPGGGSACSIGPLGAAGPPGGARFWAGPGVAPGTSAGGRNGRSKNCAGAIAGKLASAAIAATINRPPLPALAAAVAVLAVVSGVAPGEYQSPDLGQGPFLVRLARDVWPLLVLEAAAIVIGQAFAAGAVRASLSPQPISVGRALSAGLSGLRRRPLRRIAIAVGTDAALAAWLVVSWALLRVLWTPIGRQAEDGALLTPASAALLVGFVAIWLCLVAGGGVLHAWSSTWWSLEDPPGIGTRREDSGERWT